MIGFRVVNLLIPDDPDELKVTTATGVWKFDKEFDYHKHKASIEKGMVAETFAMMHPVDMADGAAACDAAFEEVTPLLLGASFLTGLSATVKRSLPHSVCQIMQAGSHWPRERAMGAGNPIVKTDADFVASLEKFVSGWSSTGQSEKILLLIHHWLDALACWSMEDLYLSATTLLQIISATESTKQGRDLSYYQGVAGAATRAGIPQLGADFKNMRNVLIHEGRLIGGSFAGRDIFACSKVAAEVLNWFDSYIWSVMQLGPMPTPRFKPTEFATLNAYSIPV
jgi:hypothetical protein